VSFLPLPFSADPTTPRRSDPPLRKDPPEHPEYASLLPRMTSFRFFCCASEIILSPFFLSAVHASSFPLPRFCKAISVTILTPSRGRPDSAFRADTRHSYPHPFLRARCARSKKPCILSTLALLPSHLFTWTEITCSFPPLCPHYPLQGTSSATIALRPDARIGLCFFLSLENYLPC